MPEDWVDQPDQDEIPLTGGDVTEGLVRVGDTVRRPAGPHSPLVHALLLHLESAGFAGAPRFLGVDSAEPADTPPAPTYPPELIGHVDITPENVVFRQGAAYALIDFDLAKLATRADEMFNAMLWWAPLSDPRDVAPLLRQVDALRRARILADAYGLSGTDRERVAEVAILRTRRSWYLMRQRAETDGGGWKRMWDEGVGDVIKRREVWLDRHAAALTAALTGGTATR